MHGFPSTVIAAGIPRAEFDVSGTQTYGAGGAFQFKVRLRPGSRRVVWWEPALFILHIGVVIRSPHAQRLYRQLACRCQVDELEANISGTVDTCTELFNRKLPLDFTAIINWGDGRPPIGFCFLFFFFFFSFCFLFFFFLLLFVVVADPMAGSMHRTHTYIYFRQSFQGLGRKLLVHSYFVVI